MSVVLLERHGDVLLVTLNRPDSLNSFNDDLHRALSDAWHEASVPDIRAVVLTGAGRGFCAGADLHNPPDAGSLGHNTLRHTFNSHTLAMAALDKPVIAAINGAALGFVAYATYDLTNQATLSVWSTRLTIIDLCWGTVLTTLSATGGYHFNVRPRWPGGENSATTASASTQRRPDAAPATNSNTNQAGNQLVNRKPVVLSTGTSAASHNVGRRPSRCVMAEANDVMANTPTQPVAASRPASALDTPSPLRRNSSSGMSMK